MKEQDERISIPHLKVLSQCYIDALFILLSGTTKQKNPFFTFSSRKIRSYSYYQFYFVLKENTF